MKVTSLDNAGHFIIYVVFTQKRRFENLFRDKIRETERGERRDKVRSTNLEFKLIEIKPQICRDFLPHDMSCHLKLAIYAGYLAIF